MPCEPIHLGDFLREDRRFPAVYFLCYRGVVVYVGQSKTLKFRIDQHLEEGVKLFDAVAFIRCSVDHLTKIEARYIRLMVPKYNVCAVAMKARERETWQAEKERQLRERHPIDPDNIKLVDASECIIPDREIGEFFKVSDRDAAEWLDAGEITDKSIMGLLYFVADNSRKVRKAQDRFEDL